MRNITDLENELAGKKADIVAKLGAFKKAEEENREVTAEERGAVDKIMAEARALKAQIDQKRGDSAILEELDRLTAGATPTRLAAAAGGSSLALPQSLGQQWIASAGYEWCKRGMHRRAAGGQWMSPGIELAWDPQNGLYATTLTEAGGAAALVRVDQRPGVQPLLQRRLVVADLIASGQTDSNAINYMQEATFTNAADTVAEGAAKPESAMTFSQVTDTVRKIAHWLPVTDETLEDAAQIRSVIDARLTLGVQLVEEDQLLNGGGVAPDLLGIRNRVGITAAYVRGTSGPADADETNADAIFRQMMIIATTALVMPTGWVMNPLNWQMIQLSKNAGGDYYGGGPFNAPQAPMLWGIRGAVTPAIVAGTATVGDFSGSAQVFRKGGINIAATNAHADYFIKNLTAIRAETRLALAVYRPAAFGDVSSLD